MKINNNKSVGAYWISISDMMTGLMIIFLFIAISYMIKIINEKKTIKEIAVTYNRLQNDLYNDLNEEFKDDLEKWQAEIDRKTLSVKFKSPDVLFKLNSTIIKPKFKLILDDFFPRYIKILINDKYQNDIEEIRIEGHTSSEWRFNVSQDQAYINNMELSQGRTRSVLNYVLLLSEVEGHKKWLKSNLTANGLSSSKIIVINGDEDKEQSRRVEFRVKTNAEDRIVRIIDESKG